MRTVQNSCTEYHLPSSILRRCGASCTIISEVSSLRLSPHAVSNETCFSHVQLKVMQRCLASLPNFAQDTVASLLELAYRSRGLSSQPIACAWPLYTASGGFLKEACSSCGCFEPVPANGAGNDDAAERGDDDNHDDDDAAAVVVAVVLLLSLSAYCCLYCCCI